MGLDTVSFCAILRCTALHCAALCCSVPYCDVLYRTVPYLVIERIEEVFAKIEEALVKKREQTRGEDGPTTHAGEEHDGAQD